MNAHKILKNQNESIDAEGFFWAAGGVPSRISATEKG